ncbi:hypothetical protein DFS33DRAFT_1251632, partial [Desarmillaria ectypa]
QMILDEKCILAPPPTYVQAIAGTNNLARRRSNLTFSSLPSHLLLQIVYCTFPLEDGEHEGDSKIVRQRENLHWLETSLRLVSRALYIACMHILRSTYLPAYNRLVRPPYTSDPFPTSSPSETQSSTSPLFTHHRELATLDRFISLLAHEDHLLDTSDLHLPREEAYKDLFDLVQPKSRLEDLTAEQGCRLGIVPTSLSSSPILSVQTLSTPRRKKSPFNLFSFGRSRKPITPPPSLPIPVERPSIDPIPFSTLTISFSPRSIGLVMNVSVLRKKTLVEISRTRDEPLEVSTKRLMQSLKAWLEED